MTSAPTTAAGTTADGLREELAAALGGDERVVVLGEDVVEGGAFGVTRGLADAFGERVINASDGVTAMGLGVGMAVYGRRPVIEVQPEDLMASLEHLNAAATMRFRSAAAYTCPLVVRMTVGAGSRSGMDRTVFPEGLLAAQPGLEVVTYSGPRAARVALRAALQRPDPVVLLEPVALYGARAGADPEHGGAEPEWGAAQIVRDGTDVTIATYGASVALALAAAEHAAQAGVQAEVLDMRTLSPIDIRCLLGSVARTGRLVVVGEGPRTGGFGAEIAALVAAKAVLHLEAPIARVSGLDVPVPFVHEQATRPGVEQLVTTIVRTANF